jgi:hypothetical protein
MASAVVRVFIVVIVGTGLALTVAARTTLLAARRWDVSATTVTVVVVVVSIVVRVEVARRIFLFKK